MTQSPRHQDQHIAVTGAGSGIGRAVALRLAEDGARLSLFARRLPLLKETAELARAAGASEVFISACDITDRKRVVDVFVRGAQALGPLQALVANAGIGGRNDPGSDDRFDALVSTNLTGSYNTLRAAQRVLAEPAEPRHLIVISSILGRIGVAGYTGYCASKAGLLGLVRALAMELASENVQVNAICPGWVDTDMAWEGLRGLGDALGISAEEAKKVAMRDVPLGRMSHPSEIAAMVSWLVSGDARGITGQALDINNGAFML
ncbi:MAG TPA: short-chain dehydrogenase [Deltaproteobacteria bacterium]|nr:short-chain dehydrogenase [Deltaproteobacteria bacterium]HCP47923.1 short-chain dehydrogenase [Deltaproteobacteria bacterium]